MIPQEEHQAVFPACQSGRDACMKRNQDIPGGAGRGISIRRTRRSAEGATKIENHPFTCTSASGWHAVADLSPKENSHYSGTDRYPLCNVAVSGPPTVVSLTATNESPRESGQTTSSGSCAGGPGGPLFQVVRASERGRPRPLACRAERYVSEEETAPGPATRCHSPFANTKQSLATEGRQRPRSPAVWRRDRASPAVWRLGLVSTSCRHWPC